MTKFLMTLTRRNRLLAAAIVLAIGGAWLLPQPSAQTALNSTTLAAAVTSTSATSISLASGTNVSAGDLLFVESTGELMRLVSAQGSSTTAWNVQRGFDGTVARTHANGARVYTGVPSRFARTDAKGTCPSNPLYSPHINVTNGRLFECEGGFWLEVKQDPVNVRENTVRDSFDGGYLIMQDDGTVKTVTDDEDNFVYGSPLGAIEYREELTKTTSSWLIADGLLDISADDGATDAEGVEIIFGVGEGADMGYLVAGTQGGCVAASITINSIVASTDFMVLGWRQNETFVDNATPASYTLYNHVGIYDTETGSITHTESGATSDDSGVDWATTETRALKVCISKAGVPSAYYTAAYTHSQTVTDRPTYILIPNVNNGTTLTAGTQLVPFFTMLYGNDGTNSNIRVNWVELTRFP